MFTFFRNPWSEPSKDTQQPAPASATSSVLLIPDSSAEGEAGKTQRDFEQSFKYASSASAARGGDVPRTLSVDMPDHLKQGIAEWLNATHGTGIGLQVSAVLLHPLAAPGTPPNLSTSPKASMLLSLPPEMRNRIYRFALLETDEISISANGPLPAEPGLLSTCTQIRAESSGIYYKQNRFLFAINNHDASQYIKWCSSSERCRHANKSFLIGTSTNWPNLVKWMGRYYHNHCGGIGVHADGSPSSIVAHICSVVRQLRDDSCLSWPQVEAILKNVRMGLGTQKTEWLDDATS